MINECVQGGIADTLTHNGIVKEVNVLNVGDSTTKVVKFEQITTNSSPSLETLSW